MHKKKSVQPDNKPVVQQPTSPINATDRGTTSSSTSIENKRYFVNNNQLPSDHQKFNNETNEKSNRTHAEASPMESQSNSVDSASDTETSEEKNRSIDSHDLCKINDEVIPFSQRKKLGTLPAFIPID